MANENGKQAVAEASRDDIDQISYDVEEDPAEGTTPASMKDGRFFMIIHETDQGVPNISRFDTEPQARAFVEEMLSQGADADGIEVCEASGMPFNVSSRPVVDFTRC